MDLQKIEQEAKDHAKQVDEGVVAVEKEADKLAGGRDHGLIDKAAQGIEKEVDGEHQGETTPPQ
jgi:hypothetical protein